MSKSARVWMAFLTVYLCWGSTYTAIHVAGEYLPVPVVGGLRSVLSCLFIAAITLSRGRSLRPPRGEWWRLALVGVLFMSCNNLLLIWGETMVPSGFASLIVCVVPVMIALLEMALPDGERMNLRGWAGTLVALLGILALTWPSLRGSGHGPGLGAGGVTSRPLLGVCVLLLAGLAWAIGSVLSRRFRFQADSFVATGWQIGSAAVVNLTLATATGGFHRAHWTPHALEAVLYLSIFGSLFGLVAYTYLLQNVAVTKVATYVFVNPIIAVLLGIVLLPERFISAEILGMVTIVAGVAMVIYSKPGSKVDRDLMQVTD
jgi:drug/metabolite transporter (DMT)-like permease